MNQTLSPDTRVFRKRKSNLAPPSPIHSDPIPNYHDLPTTPTKPYHHDSLNTTSITNSPSPPCPLQVIISKTSPHPSPQFLKHHPIPDKLRAKLMDWMIEVLTIYHQREETFFRCFQLFDTFLYLTKDPLPISKLHLIGVSCLAIASKQEEVSPLRLLNIQEDICKSKYTTNELIETELLILMTVDFRTHIPNLFEIIRTGLSLAVWEDNETSQFVETVTVLIGKMCLFSYELITQLSILELAACAICIALKLVHNLKPKLEIESFVC